MQTLSITVPLRGGTTNPVIYYDTEDREYGPNGLEEILNKTSFYKGIRSAMLKDKFKSLFTLEQIAKVEKIDKKLGYEEKNVEDEKRMVWFAEALNAAKTKTKISIYN